MYYIKKVLFLFLFSSISVLGAQIINMGDTIDGAWSSASQTKQYTFTLTEGKTVIIEYSVPNISSYISLNLKNYSNHWEGHTTLYSGFSQSKYTLSPGKYTISIENPNEGNQVFSLKLREKIISYSTINLDSITEDIWIDDDSENIEPTKFYTFTLPKRSKIVLDINNRGNLLLRNSQKEFIEKNSKIIEILKAGTYTIEVIKEDLSAEGPFTLHFQQNNTIQKDIDLNSQVNGEWTINSGYSKITKNHTEYYTFTLTKRTQVLMKVNSNIKYCDTQINLLTDEEQLIETGSTIIKTLNPGRYIMDITNNSYKDELTHYTLSFKENIIKTHAITLNSQITGKWTNNSGSSLISKLPTEYYQFTLTQRTEVAIILNSEGMKHGQIILLDEQGKVIKSDSSILMTLEAGTYTMDVTNRYDYYGETGAFTLSFKENIIKPIPISLNKTLNQEFNINSMLSKKTQGPTEHYTFTLNKKTPISVHVDTTIIHPELNLYNSKGQSLVDNNYGSSFAKILDAGTYTIVVSIYPSYSNSSAPFKITLKENIIHNTLISVNTNIDGKIKNTSGISYLQHIPVEHFTFNLNTQSHIKINISNHILNTLREGDILALLDNKGNEIALYRKEYGLSGMKIFPIDITLKAGTYTVEIYESLNFKIISNTYYDWLIAIYHNILF